MMAPGRAERGAVLAGVLCIAAAVLALAAGWFEMSSAQMRRAAGFAGRVRAFHAADAALEACTAMLAARETTRAEDEGVSEHASSGAGHRESSGERLYPFARWPDVIEPPACHVEALDSPDAASRFYLVTAHANGIDGSPPLWLQQQISMASGTVIERRWRELAGPPR